MPREHPLLADPRIQAAIAEFTAMIGQNFPAVEFTTYIGDDPVGVYLRAVVDLDAPDEVMDLIIDRLLTLQAEEELPFYVIPVRTPERAEAVRERDRRSPHSYADLVAALG